jgi:hypothetical protein
MAHRKEEAKGARWDTPGVLTLPLTGAPTLRVKAVAFEQRRSSGQNRYFEEIEELEEALVERCVALGEQPELIRSYIRYHWWPEAA